eukprot:COSAG03_NODE_3487_length_1986_cov_1.843667_1_plen_79_part_10
MRKYINGKLASAGDNVKLVPIAVYDNSVPIDSHGQQINNLEFYITNQDQQVQDMQGTNFNATVQIEWPDPAGLLETVPA